MKGSAILLAGYQNGDAAVSRVSPPADSADKLPGFCLFDVLCLYLRKWETVGALAQRKGFILAYLRLETILHNLGKQCPWAGLCFPLMSQICLSVNEWVYKSAADMMRKDLLERTA